MDCNHDSSSAKFGDSSGHTTWSTAPLSFFSQPSRKIMVSALGHFTLSIDPVRFSQNVRVMDVSPVGHTTLSIGPVSSLHLSKESGLMEVSPGWRTTLSTNSTSPVRL